MGAAAQRLADQLERVVHDRDASVAGADARALVLDRYAVPVVSAQLDRIYRQVASPVPRRRAVLHGVHHAPTTVISQLPERIKNNRGLRWCGRRIGFLDGAPT